MVHCYVAALALHVYQRLLSLQDGSAERVEVVLFGKLFAALFTTQPLVRRSNGKHRCGCVSVGDG